MKLRPGILSPGKHTDASYWQPFRDIDAPFGYLNSKNSINLPFVSP
jgi:hypothetical protein